MPPSHSGDDFIRVFGPDERLGIGISAADKIVDRILEFLDGTENTTLEAPLGQQCEQSFDCIEPRGGSWGEVEDKTRMVREPCEDLRMLVRGVVVDNDMNGQFCRHSGLDNVEEADELLMAMTRR